MKTKGIPFWEQHLEHFVLGLAVLVFIGFTAMQFIGSPNAYQVGANTYTPANVDDALRKKAEDISAKLSSSTDAAAQLPDPAQLMPVFQDRLAGAIAPAPTLVALGPDLSPSQGAAEIRSGQPFVVAAVPAPESPRVKSHTDTLVPESVDEIPDLKARFTQTPYDLQWTTTFANFKVGQVLKQFASTGPNGESPLPMRWYNDRVDFIDVKLYRQERVNGAWAERTLVNHIPGQYDLRPTLAKPIDRAIAVEVLNQVADPAVRQDITQPDFYLGKVPAWVAPTMEDLTNQPATAAVAPETGPGQVDPQTEKLESLKRKLATLNRQRDKVREQMAEINCSETAPEEPDRDRDGGTSGGSDNAAPGGGLTAGGGGRGLGGRDKKNDAKCKDLRKKLNSYNRRIKGFEDEIARLQPNEEPKAAETAPEVVAPEKLPDELLVWAHDLDVKPGHTYRYQLVVEVYNPLFGRKADLIKEQHALADQFTLASAESEWTQPVTVEPPLRVFITAARLPQDGNPLNNQSSAMAEVYRFRDGRWWMETFTVRPGDRVGGEAQSNPRGGGTQPADAGSLDFQTEWFVLDVFGEAAATKEDIEAGRGAAVILQNMSASDLIREHRPRLDGRHRDRMNLKDEVEASRLGDSVASADRDEG